MNSTTIPRRLRRKRYWMPLGVLAAASAIGLAGGGSPEAAPAPDAS
jgi:hypothetical protein